MCCEYYLGYNHSECATLMFDECRYELPCSADSELSGICPVTCKSARNQGPIWWNWVTWCDDGVAEAGKIGAGSELQLGLAEPSTKRKKHFSKREMVSCIPLYLSYIVIFCLLNHSPYPNIPSKPISAQSAASQIGSVSWTKQIIRGFPIPYYSIIPTQIDGSGVPGPRVRG